MGIDLAGLKLKNPVMVASGTFGFGIEFADLVDLNKLGAIVTKTVTLNKREGNPQPRLIEVENGLVNSIGLQNEGVDYFIKNYLPFLRKLDTAVIVNIAGETVEEYARVTGILAKEKGIDAIEVNISCPNVQKGCMAFGKDPDLTKEVIAAAVAARGNKRLPVIAKLSPNVEDIAVIAKAALKGGADILSMINTVQTTVEIPGTKKTLTAGLSGPAIKETALELIAQVRKEVKAPIIGMGGIMNALDAREFFKAGANAIAVGTASFVDPRTALRIIEGFRAPE